MYLLSILCCCLVTKSCLTFLWPPWTVTCQAPLSMGFPKQECWSRLPFPSPGDLLHPGIRPVSLALQLDILPWSRQGNPSMLILVTTELFHRFVSKTSWKWHLLVRASLDRRSIVISARKATESWECSQFQTRMEKLTHLVSILERLDHGLCTWHSQAKSICMVDTDSNILPSLVGLKTKMQAPVELSFSTYQCGNRQVHQRNCQAYVFPELRLWLSKGSMRHRIMSDAEGPIWMQGSPHPIIAIDVGLQRTHLSQDKLQRWLLDS